MVVYLADEGKVELPCQPKDNQQRATKLLNDFRIDVADDLSDTVSSQCHHLVSHDLRAQAKPILLLRSMIGRRDSLSWTSEVMGQTKMVESSAMNSSACTTMPGRGPPNSLGTTISTTSPRFTSMRPNRRPLRSNHRWPHFREAWPLS